MGHLLSTSNPAAAAEIQPAPKSSPLPPIGSSVIYTMRAGHGRNGRTRFPAFVQAHRDGRQMDLTVIIDAGDMSDETYVGEAAPGNEFHCWERSETQASSDPTQLAAIRAEIAELRELILGEYEVPQMPILEILAQFEIMLDGKADKGKPGRPKKIDGSQG